MVRISDFFKKAAMNLKTTVFRFPIVLLFLAFISVIVSILIENDFSTNESLYTRLIYAGVFGVFVNIALQFALERYESINKYKWILRILSIGLAVFYYYFMTTDVKYSQAMFVRLLVICFSLFALYLYLPSSKNAFNFGNLSLVHFKSAFTSILYGVVLFLGLTAIFLAIDLLLFNLRDEIRAHMGNIVFIFFVPTYYLSLLPKFNSVDEDDNNKTKEASVYPRVLDILVSNIVIPLIMVFSVVLIIYFVKILISGIWPVGQVGPMVLAYSTAGLFFYILGSNLQNKIALFYRKIFPFILLPLVIMQLTSAYIRIKAYGITESRYYVILFGIYSITSAFYLIFSKKKNTNAVVLLAACFAILSIIPPVDAFNTSNNSQKGRIEEILLKNNMLKDNKIVFNSSISSEDKYEITNITDYMARMGYLDNLYWIPEKYVEENNYYMGFEDIYGFKPYYNYANPDNRPQFVYANLDTNAPIDIEGFETLFKINFYTDNRNDQSKEILLTSFKLSDDKYSIKQISDEKGNLTLKIYDQQNTNVMEIKTEEFINNIAKLGLQPKSMLQPEEMTLDKQNETLRVRLVVENLSVEYPSNDEVYVNGSIIVLVAKNK